MPIDRRSLITGLISFIAAPAIVRAGSLMPVKALKLPHFKVGEWIGVSGIILLSACEFEALKVTGITDEMFYADNP